MNLRDSVVCTGYLPPSAKAVMQCVRTGVMEACTQAGGDEKDADGGPPIPTHRHTPQAPGPSRVPARSGVWRRLHPTVKALWRMQLPSLL